ncbi:MAG: ArsA family ATPase [Myxococcales bacterium]|nr:ArsA family ATPase [Myxococcales bacterium]
MTNPLDKKRVVICAGPGGVGKTTTAAAFGVAAARAGLRTAVATIDPAPRLVDALSLPSLDAELRPLPAATAERLNVPPNHLFASRIDTRQAFAELVSDFAGDPARRERILANTLYQQITTTLTGAQEYAAALSVTKLSQDPRFDLVILDTPPAANALEFFDAPGRLKAAIESPLIRWLLPHPSRKLLHVARIGSGGGVVLRALSRLVGSHFLADLGAFLEDFQPVLGGLSSRTQTALSVLQGPNTVVVGVCIAEPQAMDEMIGFSKTLEGLGMGPQAFVVNRTMPTPKLTDPDAIARALDRVPVVPWSTAAARATAVRAVADAADTVARVAAHQERQAHRLSTTFPGRRVVKVPLLAAGDSPLSLLAATAASLSQSGLAPGGRSS